MQKHRVPSTADDFGAVDGVDGGRNDGNDGRDIDVHLLVLDENAVAQLRRIGQPRLVAKVRLEEETRHESIAEDVLEDLRHFGLLLHRTVVLHREDDRIG